MWQILPQDDDDIAYTMDEETNYGRKVIKVLFKNVENENRDLLHHVAVVAECG